ncbi:MAG: patatin-like phospholipase family protein [Bacteroidales bacterium]|jgi:patatin-like phospholipase/acyl hydrolase|nr:patatin-like phospholipase family protein [Bacteroidales bacterium]
MSKKINILSIDGGGIRGIIPAIILEYMEQELQRKSGDSNATLADYFDMIAGTSTGGILTCFYLLPPSSPQGANSKYFAGEAVRIYAERGKEIFDPKVGKPFRMLSNLFSAKYSVEGLENILKEVMGDITLSQARKHCLVTAYDIANRKAVFFTTPQAKQYSHRDYYMRDIARSTSAAPTYFKLADIRSAGGATSYLIDGAMYAGDPTMCALVEANKSIFEKCANPSVKDLYIVSLGTGKEAKKYDHKKAQKWGIAQWAVPVLNILMSSSAEVVSYQVRQLFEVAGCKENYVRLEPGLCEAKPEMDDVSDENIKNLKNAGLSYIKEHAEKLDSIVNELIANK